MVIAADGVPSMTAATVRLSVVDLRTGRTVLVEPGGVEVGARNGFLWWSTGAGESRFWHILDLTTVP